jgi:hypothetical protein
MKKLLLKLCIIFIPFAIIIVATNYYVDPANIFSGDAYVDKIATILASGNNADNISNYNERLLQKHFLQKQKEKNPDVVVMGSSRVMEISSNVYGEKKILNIGVSHADINDLIALAGLMEELKIKPKEVVINVDPFLISKGDNGVGEWITLKEYHKKFTEANCKGISNTETIEEENNQLKKYYTLITFDYFKNSLEFLCKGNTKTVENVGKKTPQKNGRFVDGSIAYSYTYLHPDTLIAAYVAKSEGKNAAPETDNKKLTYLKCLIDYYKSKGVNITLILLPFHQSYFDEANANQKNVFNAYETFYTTMAMQNKVKIIGSFNAKKEGLNNIDFYDSYHCNGDALKKVFDNYKNK